MSNIFENSITDEEVVTDPVRAVHDYLALARNLIEDGNYENARSALEDAKTRLKEFEKGSDDAKASADFKSMYDEVPNLQADLRRIPSVSSSPIARECAPPAPDVREASSSRCPNVVPTR